MFQHNQKVFFSKLLLLNLICSMTSDSWSAFAAGATVTGIDFRGTSDPSQIEIHGNGPLQIVKSVNAEDKQVILEIPGATLDKSLARNIDTSSFDSPVALISPYQTSGDNPSVRIVVQLRGTGGANLNVNGNGAVLSVSKSGSLADSSGGDQTVQTGGDAPSQKPGVAKAKDSDVSLGNSGESVLSGELKTDLDHHRDDIDQLLNTSQTKHFTGKPITLQVRDVDVQDIFNLIAEASGFNIVLGSDVAGKLSISLNDVPWDQALDVVLQTLHLGADRRGNVLRVMTIATLAAEKQLELAAKRANDAITPRITRVFPISYATLGNLKTTLESLASMEQKSQQAAQTAGSVPGVAARPVAVAATEQPLVAVADERTNSIIVRGLPDYVERARKVIEILDTQTPQVVIEGKVVEATESFSNAIGGNVALTYTGQNLPGYGVSAGGGNYTTAFGVGGLSSVASGLATSSANGFAGAATQLIGSNLLNLNLSLAESEGTVKLVSSPRVVVLNKQSANMVQSFPAVISVTTVNNGTTTTTPTAVAANLSLTVNPSVTADGSVLMNLTLSRDVIQTFGTNLTPAVASRNINTSVLVESGNTLVMGGFYSDEHDASETGIPFLRQIPLLGLLFGSKNRSALRSELLFFITPQIVNSKKAGLSSS